ncbi:MAG: acyl carrier protein [Desulfamplus sp.]|nr:acyl carrier protein [Desulfamplus sp.]
MATDRFRELVNIIITQAQELNEELEDKIDVDAREDAPLFGKEGILKSIELVNLIVAVEQAVEDQFDVFLTLADEKAMSQKTSPFKTIGALAAYIEKRMDEEMDQA